MKTIGKIAIVAFCVWHMFAIFIYVIPDEASSAVPEKIEQTFLRYVRPYMYATSQWQKWNIFSPNPIRRVSSYAVSIEQEGTWKRIVTINPMELPWRWRSRELKVLRRVEDNGEGAAKAWIAFACRTGTVPRGAHVRIERMYYVIPMIHEVKRIGGWKNYEPEWNTDELASDYCP